MIVRMKKISIIVQSKDIDVTLRALRKAGLLHIEHQNPPAGREIKDPEGKLRSVLKAMDLVSGENAGEKMSCDPEDIVQKALNLSGEKQALVEGLKKVKKDIEAWKEWGDFDPELIDDLKDRDIWVRLCKIGKKELKDAPEGIILERLFKRGGMFYCAAISTKEIALPFESIPLPEQGLKEMLIAEREQDARIKEIDRELTDFSRYKPSLFSYKKELESLIEFNKVAKGMGAFESFSYLRGYCPADKSNIIEDLAEREKWALIIEDPDEADNVPTLTKNPRWVEMIKPVLQMIKTVPGYREVDISLWFLIFFSVFFGMLIGDAGYGAVFFVINLICHIRLRDSVKNKSVFFLTYVLSLCAVIWGVLTGTFFGQAYLPKRVEPLLPFLSESSNVQALCFFIGASHLSIAHAWRFIRKLPSLKAFSEAGWISMLWAAYFLARSLILGEGFPVFGKWLFMAGAAFIILFTRPARNILKGVGSGVGDLLLHIVNTFTDVVSYIRLFAVGAATVAVADAFNHMALGVGRDSFFAGFLTAFVLLFGHTLNILLGAMAILVHGVRLNVLEFSSHLDMEWSGMEYAPFRNE